MRLITLLIIPFVMLSSIDAEARFRRKKKTVRVVIKGSGQIPFTNSAADSVAGASYTKKYTNPIIAGGGLGVLLYDNWYIGGRFEHWFAGRTFDPGSGNQEDTLKYQTVGAEIGIFQVSHRLQLYVVGGVTYPVSLEVDSTAGSFTSSETPLGYYGKVIGGISFSKIHAFYVEAGYRFANLGSLSSGGAPYIPGGGDFDLSGFFGGVGFLFEF